MGGSCCNYSSGYNLGEWMRDRTRYLLLIVITLLLYSLNQKYKTSINNEFLGFFFRGYFNDIIGSIMFLSYCSIIFSYYRGNFMLQKLFHIELIMLICGLFWEFIVPLYRKDTVSDIIDLLAYMLGGLIYWLIDKCMNRL